MPGPGRAALRAAPADPRPGRDWVAEARASTSSSRRSLIVVGPAALARSSRWRSSSTRAGRSSTSTAAIGVGEREFGMLKFRTMVADAAEQQPELEDGERGVGRAVQDPRRPAGDARRARAAPASRSTSCRSSSNVLRGRDEPRRAAAAAAPRLRAARGLAPRPLPRAAGDDRALADLGPLRPLVRRPRAARLHLPRELVDLARTSRSSRRRSPPSSRGRGAY